VRRYELLVTQNMDGEDRKYSLTNEKPSTSTQLPKVGQIVQVRTRTYLVDDVVRAPQKFCSTLVKLEFPDDLQRLSLRVIDCEAWKSIGTKGFDTPKLFS
jgi:hypothetical protein